MASKVIKVYVVFPNKPALVLFKTSLDDPDTIVIDPSMFAEGVEFHIEVEETTDA